MSVICPTVTAENTHQYREQIERIAAFTERLHLDFMDGVFTPNRSLPLDQAWRPDVPRLDLHLMYKRPDLYHAVILALKPDLVIVHAEAVGDFQSFSDDLRKNGITVGVALLQKTPVSLIESSLNAIDHVLVFSGDLGHFGGRADLTLLDKVRQLKQLKPTLEIGWDGGISADNAKQLTDGGVDVLNVGGFIQRADDPATAYATLDKIVRATT